MPWGIVSTRYGKYVHFTQPICKKSQTLSPDFYYSPLYLWYRFVWGMNNPFFWNLHNTQHTCNCNTMANTNTSNTDPSNIFTSICNTYFEHISYPWKYFIGNVFINSFLIPIEPTKQLCVRPTGGGKTLLFTTIDTALKGVTICITLILYLGADQFKNLSNRVFGESWLTSFHLDGLDATIMGEVHALLQMLHPQGTVVLFASP